MKILSDTIQNIALEIRTGKTPPTSNPEYFGEEINWYTPSDLDKEKFLGKSKRGITQKAVDDKKAIIFKPNTVLIGAIGDIGKLGVTSNYSSSNQQITGIYPDSKKVDAQFLYYWLKAHKQLLLDKSKSAIVPILNNKDFGHIKISFPESVSDQLHIANLLSKAENLIAQRKESIRLLDAYLKSTFLEMFGDPARNEKGFEPITLGDLFKVSSGDGLTSDNMNPTGEHNVYGGNGVNGKHDKYMFDEPKIVIGRVGFYCGAVHLTEPKSWVTDNALYIKELYKALNIQYLKHFLTLLNLNRFAGQAAQPLISGNRLYPIKTFYAPIDLQNQFAVIVEKTEALKTKHHQSLQELENLYGSLSQKAFRGELSVRQSNPITA